MITIPDRAKTDIQGFFDMMKNGQKAKEHLPTYLEALASALDVPVGWRFDPDQMSFVPPTTVDGESHSSQEG